MVTKENPVEGRLTDEERESRLRASRKVTVKMRREYRDMVHSKIAEDKASKWAAKHKKPHTEAYEDMSKVSSYKPLNRAGRRKFAKLMNVFKISNGWKHFNNNYSNKFGIRDDHVEDDYSSSVMPTNIKSNVEQALENAKVNKKEGETK